VSAVQPGRQTLGARPDEQIGAPGTLAQSASTTQLCVQTEAPASDWKGVYEQRPEAQLASLSHSAPAGSALAARKPQNEPRQAER
jgi:hypothetical protein